MAAIGKRKEGHFSGSHSHRFRRQRGDYWTKSTRLGAQVLCGSARGLVVGIKA